MRQVSKSQITRQPGDWNDRGEQRSKSRPRLEPTTDHLVLSRGDGSLDSDGDHDDDSGNDSDDHTLYLSFFFTQEKFLENKMYTEKRKFFALNL